MIYQYYSICEVKWCIGGEDVGQSQANAKIFPLYIFIIMGKFMEQEQEVQHEMCNAGTREKESP